MSHSIFCLFIALGLMTFSVVEGRETLPGRIGSKGIEWIQFGNTDVFFYMTPEKYALSRKIVEEVNQEKLKLTVDINDYDCLTTEISAIASKYPEILEYGKREPIFTDPVGQAVLGSYAESLKRVILSQLGLSMEGVSREINFVVSQDAHKFHQDQSGNQFEFLSKRHSSLPACKIIQDLTLIDWDMSIDTFSATIIQDSMSNDRFLLPLFPKEIVGLLFMQSPEYLTREAHPSYSVPTIFPYHAVLSPIDRKGDSTPGSSKGKRLSTVLRGVVLESEIEDLKQKATPLQINRAISFEDKKGGGFIYQNGVVSREMTSETQSLLKQGVLEEGLVYKHLDRENVEIIEISGSSISLLARQLAEQFGVSSQEGGKATLLRLTKKDSGFSTFNLMGFEVFPYQKVIILNSSKLPTGYDYFNLAEDCTQQGLPWIQLYHFSPERALLVPGIVFSKLSLTPVEEILFRKVETDSMKTDGITSSKKIVTKIDLLIFEESRLGSELD